MPWPINPAPATNARSIGMPGRVLRPGCRVSPGPGSVPCSATSAAATHPRRRKGPGHGGRPRRAWPLCRQRGRGRAGGPALDRPPAPRRARRPGYGERERRPRSPAAPGGDGRWLPRSSAMPSPVVAVVTRTSGRFGCGRTVPVPPRRRRRIRVLTPATRGLATTVSIARSSAAVLGHRAGRPCSRRRCRRPRGGPP